MCPVEALRVLIEEWLRLHEATQAELARNSGVPQNVISKWVNGQVDEASPANLKKIAPTLGLTYEGLLREMGELPNDPSAAVLQVAPPRLAAFIAQVEAAFHTLTEPEWQVREEAGRALFAVKSTQRHATNGRRDPTSKRLKAQQAELEGKPNPHGDSGSDGSLSVWYGLPRRAAPSNFSQLAPAGA